MEADTARAIGYLLGLAFFGYVALGVFNRLTKKTPAPIDAGRASRERRVLLTALSAIALGIGAGVIWLTAGREAPPGKPSSGPQADAPTARPGSP